MRLHELDAIMEITDSDTSDDDFVRSTYFDTFEGTEINLVEVEMGLFFLSPIPTCVLPGYVIKRHIRVHASKTGQSLLDCTKAYAATIDFFALCLRYKGLAWSPTTLMDLCVWHPLLTTRYYKRMCQFINRIIGQSQGCPTVDPRIVVEHVVGHRPVTQDQFNEQIALLRRVELGLLADYMARGAAADCQGGCKGVVPLPPAFSRRSTRLEVHAPQ